jgi:hypothetical protein
MWRPRLWWRWCACQSHRRTVCAVASEARAPVPHIPGGIVSRQRLTVARPISVSRTDRVHRCVLYCRASLSYLASCVAVTASLTYNCGIALLCSVVCRRDAAALCCSRGACPSGDAARSCCACTQDWCCSHEYWSQGCCCIAEQADRTHEEEGGEETRRCVRHAPLWALRAMS